MAESLNGKVIAFVEARMQSEMASLIRRHGGVPYAAPALQEIYRKDDPDVQRLIRDLLAGQVPVVALQTGVGTRALLETADAMGVKDGLVAALDARFVIARSPKPGRVLKQHKIHIDVMPPEPFTTEDLVKAIANVDLAGKEVALQHYGGPNNALTRHLKERGASVREVTLYTWGLPHDRAPALALIDDLAAGKVDAVCFTSQPQVGNLVTIAAEAGKEAQLRANLGSPKAAVASVGPVSSRKLREYGFPVDVEPEHPHMGNLIVALADYLARRPVSAGR